MNKFEIGEYVIYQNGDCCEFGIVKERLSAEHGKEAYRVWYHVGDTTAVTDVEFLSKLVNASSIIAMIDKHSL